MNNLILIKSIVVRCVKNLNVFCLIITTGALLIGCTKQPQFIENLEKSFNQNKNSIFLNEVTNFEWEEVCVFISADSAPETAYQAYEEMRAEKNWSFKALSKSPYQSIFIFKDGEKFKQFGLDRQYLHLKEGNLGFRLPQEREGYSQGEKCFSKNVMFKKDLPYSVLLSAPN